MISEKKVRMETPYGVKIFQNFHSQKHPSLHMKICPKKNFHFDNCQFVLKTSKCKIIIIWIYTIYTSVVACRHHQTDGISGNEPSSSHVDIVVVEVGALAATLCVAELSTVLLLLLLLLLLLSAWTVFAALVNTLPHPTLIVIHLPAPSVAPQKYLLLVPTTGG